MITGSVNVFREAIINLIVQDANGQNHEIQTIIDTGFNGSLTLPNATIESWRLPYRTTARVELGDGSIEETMVYGMTVIWDDQRRRILVESAETDPLMGMMLLEGYEFSIHVRDAGTVTISRLP